MFFASVIISYIKSHQQYGARSSACIISSPDSIHLWPWNCTPMKLKWPDRGCGDHELIIYGLYHRRLECSPIDIHRVPWYLWITSQYEKNTQLGNQAKRGCRKAAIRVVSWHIEGRQAPYRDVRRNKLTHYIYNYIRTFMTNKPGYTLLMFRQLMAVLALYTNEQVSHALLSAFFIPMNILHVADRFYIDLPG